MNQTNNCLHPKQLNEIEGYYDAKNNIVFLHLISPFDTDQMTKVLKKLDRKLKERVGPNSDTEIQKSDGNSG